MCWLVGLLGMAERLRDNDLPARIDAIVQHTPTVMIHPHRPEGKGWLTLHTWSMHATKQRLIKQEGCPRCHTCLTYHALRLRSGTVGAGEVRTLTGKKLGRPPPQWEALLTSAWWQTLFASADHIPKKHLEFL